MGWALGPRGETSSWLWKSYLPFTPVIRSTTSADKAIKHSMLCPAALSHQNSYFGSERGRLSYPNYLPGGDKVGHVTSLEVCCCLMNFPQHFSEKNDNRTNQCRMCFWQMVAGFTNYDLEILYSICYIATTALHAARPGKRCFHTRVTPAQVLIRTTDPTIFPD